MRPRSPILRRAVWLACLCIALAATHAHAGETHLLSADFDGDGQRDPVSVDRHDSSMLRIRLSANRSTEFIRLPQPLRHVTAVDLNGDRRAELIADTSSRGLQVWTRARTGFRLLPGKMPRPRHGMDRTDPQGVDDDEDGPPALTATADAGALALLAATHRSFGPPRTLHEAAGASRDLRDIAGGNPFAPRPPPSLSR